MGYESRRGSALLIALIVSLATSTLAVTVIAISHWSTRGAESTYQARRGLYVAEAGINASIQELNTRVSNGGNFIDPDGDGPGTLPQTTYDDSGSYQVTAIPGPPGTDLWTLQSLGEFGGVRKGIEVIVESNVNLPVRATMTIFGPSTNFNILDLSSKLKISGLAGNVPGLLVTDKAAFDKVLDLIDNELTAAQVKTSFQGKETTTWTKKENGAKYEGSIVQDPGATLDVDFWESVRLAIIDKAVNDWAPNANYVFKSSDSWAGKDLGTPGNPKIVVLDGTLQGSSFNVGSGQTNKTLTGAGTLIVKDAMLNSKTGGTIDWQGDIIILPQKKTSEVNMESNGGKIVVQGNVFGVGNGAGDVEIESETPSSSVTVNGNIFMLSDPNVKGDAEVSANKGVLNVNGLVVMKGDKSNAEFEGQGKININGAVMMGAPTTSGGYELPLTGNVNLTYDKGFVNNALAELGRFVGSLGVPAPYVAKSWREYIPQAGGTAP